MIVLKLGCLSCVMFLLAFIATMFKQEWLAEIFVYLLILLAMLAIASAGLIGLKFLIGILTGGIKFIVQN